MVHALAWYGLRFPAPAKKPNVVGRIEVELIAPPQPPAVPEPGHAAEPVTPSPSRPVERRIEAQDARPDPARIPEPVPVPPAPSVRNDGALPAPPDTPASERAPSPKAGPVENEPVTAPQFSAAYMRNPTPPYPAAARRFGYEGSVVIRARVQVDGSADRVEVKQSSGYEVLDRAALEAVRKWRFIPARRGNEAVVEWVDIPWKFKLEDE